MNGSKSPAPATRDVDAYKAREHTLPTTNGHRSPSATNKAKGDASPVPSIEAAGDAELPDAPASAKENGGRGAVIAGDEDAASEAETLIDSPVKRKEAEKRAIRNERPQKSRIGSLPVPGDDDDDPDSMTSPVESTEMSASKAASVAGAKEDLDEDADAEGEPDVDMIDEGSDKEGGSELSSVRSDADSRASSPSRALSEEPNRARNGKDDLTNPRKRKHRASSVDLPSSKRQSMDPPRRRLRGMHSEGNVEGAERSPSPKPRSHRRAVSTQSALDGTADSKNRKRKQAMQFPVREPKSARGWEESDASSETTSRGQDDSKRPLRGVGGRSGSTPGRPAGREHKRHVNKYGFTRLAEACEEGDVGNVKYWREQDPDQLELAEFAGNKPLQIAALNGNSEVVTYLIEEGCQIDCANVDKDTPLIDAAENGHLEVVKLLLDAGVDPLRQNRKGQQALDVVTDENEEEATQIVAVLHAAIDRWNSSEAKLRRDEEEEHRHRAGPSKELHFMARTYENLLKLVQNNDRNGVREFLMARVPVDNAVIAAAAKTGDLYLVNMLLAEMTDKKRGQKPEKPMLSVLGTSHFEMVNALTELDSFNPLWRSRHGKTWPELAEERNGPMWRQEKELLQRLYDRHGGNKDRRSSSPVTKRDQGKRRLLQHKRPSGDEDESEEDGDLGPAKRKNGRRLMSRKDMRAASGRNALSESESDSDDDEEEEEEEGDTSDAGAPETTKEGNKGSDGAASMQPPGSPTTRRQTSRLRSKSASSQTSDTSPKALRRRSSSLRGNEKALPPVKEEKGEDKDASAEEEIEVKRKEAAAAKLALEEAARLEAKRKEAEEAEAAAKRAEQEAARKAEEERRAEEHRIAEEARNKEEQEAEKRRLEEIRQAEEERLRNEQARAAYQADVLAALPPQISRVLDPNSDFTYQGDADESHLMRYFSNHLRVMCSPPAGAAKAPHEHWLLSIQAAPLMGKQGLQLLLKPGQPGYEQSPFKDWTTEELTNDDWAELNFFLNHIHNPEFCGEIPDSSLAPSEQHRKISENLGALSNARTLLRSPDCAVLVRRVRLTDVCAHLDPLLHDSKLDVWFAPPSDHRLDAINARLDAEGVNDVIARMAARFEARCNMPAHVTAKGGLVYEVRPELVQYTKITVVHEK